MCAVQAKEAPHEQQAPGDSLTATPETELASTAVVTSDVAPSLAPLVPGAVRDQPGHQLMQHSCVKPTAAIDVATHAGAEQPSHTTGVMQKPALLSSGSPLLMPIIQAGSQQAASASPEPAMVSKALQFSFEAAAGKSGEGGLLAQASAALAEQQQLAHQLSHAVGSISGTEAAASPKGPAASLSGCDSHEVQPVGSLQPGSPAGHNQTDASLDALAAKVAAMLTASQLLSPENSQGDLPSHEDASPAALVHHGFGQGSVMSRAHAARGLSGHSPALTSPAGSRGTSFTSPAGIKGTFITSLAGSQGASFTTQQPLQVCVHATAGVQSRADSSLSMASRLCSLQCNLAALHRRAAAALSAAPGRLLLAASSCKPCGPSLPPLVRRQSRLRLQAAGPAPASQEGLPPALANFWG